MRLGRFPDLVGEGFVKNRMAERRLVEKHGFPPPIKLSPNTLVWDLDAWAEHVEALPRRVPPKEAAQAKREVV